MDEPVLRVLEEYLVSPDLLSYEFVPFFPSGESFVYEEGHLGLTPSTVKSLIRGTRNPLIRAMLLPELPDSWISLRAQVKEIHDVKAELEKWLYWNALVLNCHKKSGDTWDFRSYVARAITARFKLPVSELSFVARHAELHPHNYYALQYYYHYRSH